MNSTERRTGACAHRRHATARGKLVEQNRSEDQHLSGPFWIGYGFSAGSSAASGEEGALGEDTRFELVVDGEQIELALELELEGGVPRSKLEVASFPAGLEPGWHRFAGRWYDDGALVLTSDKTIQFVE